MSPERPLAVFQQAYDDGDRYFADCRLVGKALRSVHLQSCTFRFVTFDELEFRDVTFENCVFDASSFKHVRITEGVRFVGCTFDTVGLASSVVQACLFRICTFSSPDLVSAEVADCIFDGCRFAGAENARHRADEGDPNPHTFAGARLVDVSFRNCAFERVDIAEAQLQRVAFIECRLSGVYAASSRWTQLDCVRTDFARVVMDGAVLIAPNFIECTFTDLSLVDAELDRASFRGCFMKNVDLSRTRLVATDLTPFCEARAVLHHKDPPRIDWQSVCKSTKNPALHLLLVACGVPDIVAVYLVDAARALDPEMLFKMMRSTFISYGAPDRDFAVALQESLEQNGVRTFLFEKDAKPGDRLHRVMHEGVNSYDRVILVCSEASLIRPGVKNEIEETLAREARDGGASYLIPVARDRFVFVWQDILAARIRDRVVADFTRAAPGGDEFKTAVQKLLRALRIDVSNASGA